MTRERDPKAPLKVAFVTQAFTKGMGYIENAMPRHLARQGVDVHLITMDLSPYFPKGVAPKGAMVRKSDLPVGLVEKYDGYTLHVLAHKRTLGYPRPLGYLPLLRELRPDIVQTITAIGHIAFQSAFAKSQLGYRLFTGSHTHASQFPLADKTRSHSLAERAKSFATRWVPGRLVSLRTERCYSQTTDSAEVAATYFGVQRQKVETLHLGVETDVFYPPRTPESLAERARTRKELGFNDNEIVCIYTGKLTKAKNSVGIAQACRDIRENHGLQYRAFFIGEGELREALGAFPECPVLHALPHGELARYYRAADVGVWPTNESVSALDAAACGLPLIVGDLITDRQHAEGNGFIVKAHDAADLVRGFLELKDPAVRARLGKLSAEKMVADYSWSGMATARIKAYRSALGEG